MMTSDGIGMHADCRAIRRKTTVYAAPTDRPASIAVNLLSIRYQYSCRALPNREHARRSRARSRPLRRGADKLDAAIVRLAVLRVVRRNGFAVAKALGRQPVGTDAHRNKLRLDSVRALL